MKKLILSVMLALAVLPMWAADITPAGMKQGDLVDFLYDVQENYNDRLLTSVSVANGTATASVKITSAGTILYNGNIEPIAAVDNTIGSIACTAQATATTCWYLFTYDCANDTMEVTKGTAGTLTLSQFEAGLATTNVPLAVLSVANTSGGDFILGTTSFGASGITEVYYQLPGVNRFTFTKTISNTER